MLYRIQDGKIFARRIEYSVAGYCNLRCRGCSHLSPHQPRQPPSAERFEADLRRLGEVYRARQIRLLGGEPLLHPDVLEFIRIARRSEVAPKVSLATNGLLLRRMPEEFWHDLDFVVVTLYPGVRLSQEDLDRAARCAEASQTKLHVSTHGKFRTTVLTRPQPADRVTRMIFRTCRNAHKYQCHLLQDGFFFRCAFPPYLTPYLQRLAIDGYVPANDGVSLHEADDLFTALKEYLFCPAPLDACRFCLGYVGKRMKHELMSREELENPSLYPVSRRSHMDWPRFAKESIRYCLRRLAERVTARSYW